jgi:hypothetical protein
MRTIRVVTVAAMTAGLLLGGAQRVIGEPIDGCGVPLPEVPVTTEVPPLPAVPQLPQSPKVPSLPPVDDDLPVDVCDTLSTPAEDAPDTTVEPGIPSVPVSAPSVIPPPPPTPLTGGCRAIDPGTPTCTFDASGWIELEAVAVMAYADITVGNGRAGGFTGAGYDPPQRFGVVLPASPGDRVVVRAVRGWVVARPHRSD